MARQTFDIGDLPVVTCLSTDVDGTATDPTTVQVSVIAPNGELFQDSPYTTPDANITNPTTGTFVFTFPLALNDDGPWHVRFEGTAGLEAAAETTFNVRESKF